MVFCKYLFIDKKPSKDWPLKGQITFKNFYLRYSLDTPHVLKDLNIKIESMEKVILSSISYFETVINNHITFRLELLVELVLESHP